MPVAFLNGPYIAYEYEAVTVATVSIGLDAAKLQKARTTNDSIGGTSYTATTKAIECYMTLETAQIRWTCDGTTPTTTVGHLMEVGESITLHGHQNLSKFRSIRTGGTSGSLRVSYFSQ